MIWTNAVFGRLGGLSVLNPLSGAETEVVLDDLAEVRPG